MRFALGHCALGLPAKAAAKKAKVARRRLDDRLDELHQLLVQRGQLANGAEVHSLTKHLVDEAAVRWARRQDPTVAPRISTPAPDVEQLQPLPVLAQPAVHADAAVQTSQQGMWARILYQAAFIAKKRRVLGAKF